MPKISTEALAEFMDVHDAAALLGMSQSGVRRLDDALQPVRLGRNRVRYYDPDRVIALRDRRIARE